MATYLMSGNKTVTYVTAPCYNSTNGGLCIVAVRTRHTNGTESILRMDLDSYYDGANAFIAAGGVFAPGQFDEQIGWSGETASYDVNENTTVTITPDTFGE